MFLSIFLFFTLVKGNFHRLKGQMLFWLGFVPFSLHSAVISYMLTQKRKQVSQRLDQRISISRDICKSWLWQTCFTGELSHGHMRAAPALLCSGCDSRESLIRTGLQKLAAVAKRDSTVLYLFQTKRPLMNKKLSRTLMKAV